MPDTGFGSAIVKEMVRKASIINNFDPISEKSWNDSKWPRKAYGCPQCRSKGIVMNVIMKSDLPYLVAIPCQCIETKNENYKAEAGK